MFVAMPTAMPEAPFSSSRGAFVGRTVGSWRVSSKFRVMSTVSLSMSARTSSDIFSSLASVYRIAAGESPSIEPKLPWP